MALPVWVTNTNLGSIFENTNLIKDLDTTVATDTFDLVITSELVLSPTLNVATKLINVNGITAHLGGISPGTLTSNEFGSALETVTGINLGGQFTTRAISATPALLEDIILVQIVVEGRVPSFPLTGSVDIGSSLATTPVAVGGIANIGDLVIAINAVTNNPTFGVLAVDNNGGLRLIRANNLVASDIVINTAGISGGDTGLVDGTFFLGLNSFVKAYNSQRVNNINSFSKVDNSSGVNNFASTDFTTGTWTKTNMTAALVAATTDPDGAPVYRIETDGGGATAEVTADVSVTIGDLRTFKVNAKLEDTQWISMFADQSGGTAWFDVTNGLVGTVDTLDAQITSLGNGWYECRIDYIAAGTDANDVQTIRFVDDNDTTVYTIVAGDSNLFASVASHPSGNNVLLIKDSLSGIGIIDTSAGVNNFQLDNLFSTVTQSEIVANFNLITGTSNVTAATINLRIELVGPAVLIGQGDAESSDILELLSLDTAGSALLDSPITEWLSISPTLGVLTGLVPEVLFTINVSITVRATDAPPTASADRDFLLVIQPAEAENVISWTPGNIGSFPEKSVSEASINITNFNVISDSVNIFARSERVFDFSQVFDLEWDLARTTTASFINGEGILAFVGNNVPRFHFEFNEATSIFDKIGTIIEPLKANHTNHSEDFTMWTTSDTSTILGFQGPDEIAGTATRFFNNTANSTHYLLDSASVIPAYEQMTFSVFVQAAGHDRFQLRFDGVGTQSFAIFDLTLGTVETAANNLENSGIIRLANNWYRVWIQTAFDVTSVTGSQMVLVGSETGDLPSYVGTTEGVIIYGAQTELGELTSYIESCGGITTRQADNVTLPLLNLDYNFVIKGTSVTATNLLLQSNVQTSSTWIKTNMFSSIATTVVSPTGSAATRLIDDGGGGAQTVSIDQPVTVPPVLGSFTFSVYLKRDTVTWVEFESDDYDTTTSTWFNITIGVVGTQNHDIAGIDNIGDGWYRCWIVFDTTGELIGDFRILMASADGVSTITADGTNIMYIWGAQAQSEIAPTILVETLTVQVTSTLDFINSFRTIDTRQLTLLPITKDNIITSVTIDKFEQARLILDENLEINNDASISGFMPEPDIYTFELVVLYKTTVILGPDTFSLTTTTSNFGSWNIFIPILAGEDIFSQWQTLQSNLFNDFDVFKPTDINFGFGRFEIIMGYGFDESATLENLDVARDNFDKFEGLVGDLKFLPASTTYDAVFFEMENERLYQDTSSSTFETFVDVKFGATIRPHSFEALRIKMVNNVGFKGGVENLPTWATTWAPRLIVGYVASGQGNEVVAKYNADETLQTLKGRVLPIDQIIVKDRLDGFVPTDVVGSLYTMTSVGFTFQSWQRHDFDSDGGFTLVQGPDGNTSDAVVNNYMVDWGRDIMWAKTLDDSLLSFDIDSLTQTGVFPFTSVVSFTDNLFNLTGLDISTGYLVGAHENTPAVDHWNYILNPATMSIITEFLHTDASNNGLLTEYESYVTLTHSSSGDAAVISSSILGIRVHTFPALVKQFDFTGPNPTLLYLGGPDNFWNAGPVNNGAVGEAWGAWISPDEIQIQRYAISSNGIVSESFNGATILKEEVSPEEWLHTDPGPIMYYNEKDGSLLFYMTKRTSNDKFLLKWNLVEGLVWFKSVDAVEQTADITSHSTVLNGDDIVLFPPGSDVDVIDVVDAIVTQNTLLGSVSNFETGSGVWNSVNTTFTILPNDGDFQVFHISKEELNTLPVNITLPVITEVFFIVDGEVIAMQPKALTLTAPAIIIGLFVPIDTASLTLAAQIVNINDTVPMDTASLVLTAPLTNVVVTIDIVTASLTLTVPEQFISEGQLVTLGILSLDEPEVLVGDFVKVDAIVDLTLTAPAVTI